MTTFDPSTLSPAQWPPKVGELAITLSHPRGYAVKVLSITGALAKVQYLDSLNDTIEIALANLIATGKTPQDIVDPYTLEPVQWDQAIDLEMSMPDMTQTRKSKSSSGSSTAKPKKLSANKLAEAILTLKPDQLEALKSLLGGKPQ